MNDGRKTRMRIFERFMQARNLLAAMILIQVLWLGRKWLLVNVPIIPPCFAYAVVVGVAIALTPAGWVSRVKHLREHLLQNEKLLILTLCVIVLVAGVVYAIYMRVSPDEANNLEASRIVALEGVAPFFTNYGQLPWLGFQHPPLVPLVHGFIMRLFGVNLLAMRFVTVVLGFGVVLVTYFLGSELYDRTTGFLAAFLLLSFPLFLRVGVLANNDMPVTFFFSLALLLTLTLLRTPVYWLSVAAGIVIGAGLLSKYTMALIYATLLSGFVINGRFRRLKLHLGIVSLVSVGVLAAWLVYAYQLGVLAAHGEKIVSYAGVGLTPQGGLGFMAKWRTEFRLTALLTTYPYSLGIFNIPILILGGVDLVRRRSQSDLFVLLWIATLFVPLILTLPVNRYFMPAFPALAIVMAHGLRRVPEAMERALVLALLYGGQALYLDIVLYQAVRPFFR